MASQSTNISRQKRIGRFFELKTIIQLLAVLSLVAAYFIGFSLREKNELVNLQKHYPQERRLRKSAPSRYCLKLSIAAKTPIIIMLRLKKHMVTEAR